MKVGDLVTMDYTDWPDGDEWGAGIVVEINDSTPSDVAVLWSKIGLSWESIEMIEVISENR
jgi:hypothetical protein